jgi:uncharacterized protein YcbX
MRVGRITEIWRYPVSSLRGERLEAASMDDAGIVGDRIWGMVDAETGAVANPDSEKRWRFAPQLLARLGGEEPEISSGDGSWHPARSVEARLVASRVAGFPVAFRRHGPSGATPSMDIVVPRYARDNLHILTSASMRKLAELAPTDVGVDPRRFRPNIVIDMEEGLEGFVEQTWIGRVVALGSAKARITEPCSRCSFTALAQGDLPFAPAVLQSIARHGNGGFGVLATIIVKDGIRVGDDAIVE